MSKSSHEKLNLKSSEAVERKHKLARGGLALLLAGTVLTGAGCSGDKVSATTPEVNPSTTTESVVEKPTETIVEPTEQYADAMEVYGEMSVSEFEALPREERLKYAQFLIDKTNSGRDYEIFYSEGSPGEPYKLDLVEFEDDMNNQEILNSLGRRAQLAFLQSEFSDDIKIPIDKLDARKLLSGVFYGVGVGNMNTISYNNFIEDINSSSYIHAINPNLASVSQDVGIGNEGVNKLDGSLVEYKDIEGQLDGKSIYYRVVLCNFINYDGQDKSVWLLDAMAGDQQSLSLYSDIE